MTRLVGSDPFHVRLRLLAVETIASIGIIAVIATAGRIAQQ